MISDCGHGIFCGEKRIIKNLIDEDDLSEPEEEHEPGNDERNYEAQWRKNEYLHLVHKTVENEK